MAMSPIRPELGRIDFSPISRGGQAFGQGVGQGLAQLGAGIGSAIQQHREKKKDKADFEEFRKFSENLGLAPDEASVAWKTGGKQGAWQWAQSAKQGIDRKRDFGVALDALVTAYPATESGTNEFSVPAYLKGFSDLGGQDQKVAMAVLQLGDRFGMIPKEIGAKELADIEKTKAETEKLKAETDRLVAEAKEDPGNADIWDMPFDQMPADMKAAYIFHTDLGWDRESSIKSAYGLEGPSVSEQIREMESMNFGGHPLMDLWRLTSMDGFKEKDQDGVMELSAGRGANKVKLSLSKGEYEAFKKMKQKYSDKVASVMKTDIDLLKEKYDDGSTATFDGVSGTVQHTPDGIYLVTSEGRYPITD